MDRLGWFRLNSGGRTHPVGEKAPNSWGLHDMHGNVYEWCMDWYGPYTAEGQRDPMGAAEGQDRVIRGGGWDFLAGHCRSAYRYGDGPGYCDSWLGFRLAAVQSR